MKKIITLIALFVIVIIFLVVRGGSDNSTQNTKETTDSFQPDPANATFVFDQGAISLSQGKHSVSLVPGSAIKEETSLTSIRGYGDLNNDKKNDTAVILTQSGGGSGVFIYLAGYVSGPVNYKGTNAIFIGDRITPKSITINNGIITVNYLDRKNEEPFAAEPSVPVSRTFVYERGALVEK